MDKSDKNITLFRYVTSKIDLFSFSEENYDNEDNNMELKISFGVDMVENMRIICNICATFSTNQKQFLSITTSSLFKIEEESWENLIDKENNNITIEQDLCRVFAHTSMNVTRGILVAKLERTKADNVQIPGIPVNELSGGNLVLSLDNSKL